MSEVFLGNLKKSSKIKVGLSYSLASIVDSVVAMFVSFLNMRLLGPELLGIWQSITIVNSYLPFAQLGIQSGLNLELPILIGESRDEEAMSCVATGNSFAKVLSAILFVIGFIVTIVLFSNDADTKVVLGVIAVTVIAVISCFRLHFIATYRSAVAFDRLAKIYLFDSFLSLALLVFILLYKYYGLLLYQVLKELIVTCLMWYFSPYRKVKGVASRNSFKLLLKRGLFMTCINQTKGVIDSFPRLILLSIGGSLQVGLFSPAISVGSFMNMLPNQIASYLQPQMGQKYGMTHQAKDMWVFLRTLAIIIPIIMIPISMLGWVLIPFVLKLCFPNYLASLWPIRVMLIGFVFSTSFLTRNFIITLKAYKQVAILYLIDAVCFIALPFICIKLLSYDIATSLAIGLSIGYFISYVSNICVVRHTIMLDKYNMKAHE